MITRRRELGAIVVLAVLLAAAPLRADGLVFQLPADGVWAEYEVKLTVTVDGRAKEKAVTLRLASVGQTTRDGVACRWIELKTSRGGPDLPEEIVKILLPEKLLGPGTNPLAKVLRGWRKRGDNDVQELKRLEMGIGPLALFLGRPMSDVKKLDAQTLMIDGLGKLACDVQAGKSTLPFEADQEHPVEVTVWRCDRAPFGCVQMKLKVALDDKTHAVFEARCVKTGKDARSELPDAK